MRLKSNDAFKARYNNEYFCLVGKVQAMFERVTSLQLTAHSVLVVHC